MKKNYLILVLAHSVHGRIRRLHIPHYFIHIGLYLALFGVILGTGFVSSYARMFWKVSELNELRAENQVLQKQNEKLKRAVKEREVQLSSLGDLATEVSIAFGLQRRMPASPAVEVEGKGGLDYGGFANRFDSLRQVSLSSHGSSPWRSLENTSPSVWPVQGPLSSGFGRRLDPFAGRGAFHTGIDIRARSGRPVVATADGIVKKAGWAGSYGKRVVLDHGRNNNLTTVYAHLSEVLVRPAQVVRRGELIGRVGSTGRSTGSHLHYEVRHRGNPVNPYRYLKSRQPRRPVFNLAD